MEESGNNLTGEAREALVQLLIGEQTPLLYYITRLLGDPHAAATVLQETNLVLWRKADDFTLGTSFSAWSRQVAYWQVQAYVRDRKRDRHVFSEELVEQLAARNTEDAVEPETRVALRHCMQQLSRPNTDLLKSRYDDGLPIAAIAKHVGKTQEAVRAALMRIRRSLLNCIERQLTQHQ